MVKNSQAATINAASCSYSDVAAAVAAASAGDTVSVPPGSGALCTWNSSLTITKGIKLMGAGAGSTTITSNYAATNPGNTFDSGNFLIVYDIANPSLNTPFRISGFTFDFNAKSAGIQIINNSPTVAQTNIQIDNNILKNASFSGGSARAILPMGELYGVIYKNQFIDNYLNMSVYGASEYSWPNFPFTYGSANYLYAEDNILSGNDVSFGSGLSGRYVNRYNTGTTTASHFPWYDMHGNQDAVSCQTWSTRGAEIYGNLINSVNNQGVRILDHRGGEALLFYNKAATSGSVDIQVREEYDDAICDPGHLYTLHVSNSYYWANVKNTTLVTAYIATEPYWENGLAENVDFWSHVVPFTGVSGMGCGTLANRPATCTTGVGYWATNQSCSNMTGMVGANPATPISGILYKCTSTNTWTSYYTPFAYPHPLRLESIQTCSSQGYYCCPSGYSCSQPASGTGCTGTCCASQSACTLLSQYFLPEQFVQAENGIINPPMQAGSDGTNTYIYASTDGNGSASYAFQIQSPGNYRMKAMVNSNNDGGQNSFYVGLDTENAQNNNYYTYSSPIISDYVWDNVNRTGNGTTLPEFDPMTWDLTAGLHTFTFYGRESNTWLDQIILKRVTADTTPPAAPTGVTVQ